MLGLRTPQGWKADFDNRSVAKRFAWEIASVMVAGRVGGACLFLASSLLPSYISFLLDCQFSFCIVAWLNLLRYGIPVLTRLH